MHCSNSYIYYDSPCYIDIDFIDSLTKLGAGPFPTTILWSAAWVCMSRSTNADCDHVTKTLKTNKVPNPIKATLNPKKVRYWHRNKTFDTKPFQRPLGRYIARF